MKEEFSITSKNFEQYKIFKKEAEKLGWKYNESFSPFIKKSMKHNKCLHFCLKWKNNNDFNPKFAFSNSYKAKDLDSQFMECIEALNVIKQLPKVHVSLKEIADYKGCKIEQLIIK